MAPHCVALHAGYEQNTITLGCSQTSSNTVGCAFGTALSPLPQFGKPAVRRPAAS